MLIGKLILSSKNTYKQVINNKSKSCKKCIILSENYKEDNEDNEDNDKLIITTKEFSSRDIYISLKPDSNIIDQILGTIGNKNDDLNLYHYLYTKNWMSNKEYKKLWLTYIFDDNYDIVRDRQIYNNQVITVDPKESVDLDDGFYFNMDNNYYYLDIHIADPISYFDFSQPCMIKIFNEFITRVNTCYIPVINNDKIGDPIHLLPNNIVDKITLLISDKIDNDNNDNNDNKQIYYKRSLCFKFKINKETKHVEFDIIPVKLTNIFNTNYDDYDIELNKDINKKLVIIKFINFLIDIMNLNYIKLDDKLENINNFDISHIMIEIFMIFVNYYSGKYFEKNSLSMIVRAQDKYEEVNLSSMPSYVHAFLNHAASYKLTNDYANNYHNALNINNYCHVSSPMRRVVDMINHMLIYNIDLNIINNIINDDIIININTEIKRQKRINNAYELVKYLDITNKFKACILDFNTNPDNNITNLLLVVTNNNLFKKIINVEVPLILINKIELCKYKEIDVEIYYNSNNFKSSKFPFSIKII
jgi:exoribonuclease R